MTNKPGIDLAALDTRSACNKPFRLELTHPTTNEPLGVFINVLGKDSDVVQEHVKTSVNAKIRKDAFNAKRGKPEVPTVEQGEAEQVELLTVATFGSEQPWSYIEEGKEIPGVKLGKQVLDFNPANIRKLYTEQKWIARQVDAAIGDLENFMRP